jgi:glycosyltransferase involved in cell wall biosynthesis
MRVNESAAPHPHSAVRIATRRSQTRNLRVLLELGSCDMRIGAVNDALDLARLGTPLGTHFTFCGVLDDALREAVRPLGVRCIRGRSRMLSKFSLPLYVLSVVAWMCRLAWQRPDVVHLNYVSYAPSLACAAWLCGIPVVARAGHHCLDPDRGANWIAAYLANCRAQADALLRSPVRDAVEIVGDLFRPERLDQPPVRDLPACRPDTVRLLFLGQLVPRKGLAVLVEALSRVSAPADLMLVGGNWNDAGHAQDIRALVAHYGLQDRVHLENHREDAGALLRHADVFVLPSFEEARPRSIIEATRLGVPVIASATGGIPSLIEDGVNGVLVPPGDVEALAGAIEALAADSALRRRLAENARVRAERECRPEDTAKRYVAVYARLAARALPAAAEWRTDAGQDASSV